MGAQPVGRGRDSQGEFRSLGLFLLYPAPNPPLNQGSLGQAPSASANAGVVVQESTRNKRALSPEVFSLPCMNATLGSS
jgi:hypothetical protein